MAEKSELSRDAISRIERGKRCPRLETLWQVTNAVGITLSQFLDFHEEPRVNRARNERTRSFERVLERAEPWLADALVSGAHVIVKAQVKARRRQALSPRATSRSGKDYGR